MNDRLLSRRDAAQFLGVEISTLESWACRRFGPSFVKVGRLVKYRATDLEKFLRDRTVEVPHAGA